MAGDREAEVDKLERVARALCAVDGENRDEQEQTGSEPREFRPSEPIMTPRWQTAKYQKEARRFVAAFEAMRAAELEPTAEAVPEGNITSGG